MVSGVLLYFVPPWHSQVSFMHSVSWSMCFLSSRKWLSCDTSSQRPVPDNVCKRQSVFTAEPSFCKVLFSQYPPTGDPKLSLSSWIMRQRALPWAAMMPSPSLPLVCLVNSFLHFKNACIPLNVPDIAQESCGPLCPHFCFDDLWNSCFVSHAYESRNRPLCVQSWVPRAG